MNETLSSHTDRALREALRRRALARRGSIADVVREMLDEALIERQADLRAARLLTALLRPRREGARRRREAIR